MTINNSVRLIGRLTRDPETKTIKDDISLTTFTLAVDRPGKDSGTDFINITTWRKTAENCGRYLFKGSQAAVDGWLQLRNYDDKEGIKRTAASVVADEVKFLDPAKKKVEDKPEEKPVFDKEDEISDEDIPF